MHLLAVQPTYFELPMRSDSASQVASQPERMFEIGEVTAESVGSPISRVSPEASLLKRALDLSIAASLLIALMPLLFLVACAVRCSSSGPVIYRQRRLGFRAREFTLLNFVPCG